jgi:hypothetical protein
MAHEGFFLSMVDNLYIKKGIIDQPCMVSSYIGNQATGGNESAIEGIPLSI